MELLTHPIPAVILLLGLLIFVHEAGHFLIGKLFGIGVETFSIGFGPPIFNIRREATDYRLSWIPLGGYVKFYGMTKSEPVPPDMIGREFHKAGIGARAATMIAGPLANFLLAFVAYCYLGAVGIPHPQAIMGEIRSDSAASEAGFIYGDRVVDIDGVKISTWEDMRSIISESPEKPLKVTVVRDSKEVVLELRPKAVDTIDILDKNVTVGRAGVARGALSSVISVIDSQSQAAKAGLRSGDYVSSVQLGSEKRPIRFWRGMARAINDAFNQKLDHITLEVGRPPEDDEVAKDSPTRFVELEFDGVSLVKTTNPYDGTNAELLGISDGQLVVESLKESAYGDLIRGDTITSWNGISLRDIFHLSDIQMHNKLSKVKLGIVRNFEQRTISISMEDVEIQKPAGKDVLKVLPVKFLAKMIEPDPWIEKYDDPLEALWYGVRQTTTQAGMLVVTLGKLIAGDFPLKALGGPMMIAKVAGDSAKAGFNTFVNTMALISVNLAVINLFPIPVLDGGQLVICGIEFVRRKRLSDLAIENFQKIGFVMILALVILATYNDLSRFWTSMLESISGLFQ